MGHEQLGLVPLLSRRAPPPFCQDTHLPDALLAISSANSSLSCSACRRARSDEASSWGLRLR